jgi:hypothetical protein
MSVLRSLLPVKLLIEDDMSVSDRDTIPEHFSNTEEAGKFWDTHSAADYWDEMEPVEMEFDIINVPETPLLSEPALAKDWNRPEEDEAWSHLQSDFADYLSNLEDYEDRLAHGEIQW